VRRQSLLITAQVLVVCFVGVLLGDLGFLFWSMHELAQSRLLTLKNTAQQLALLSAAGPSSAPELTAVAKQAEVEFTVLWRDGEKQSTFSVPPVVVHVEGRERYVQGGFEHVVLTLPEALPAAQIIVSRPLLAASNQVLAVQQKVLWFGVSVMVVMVLLSWLFFRRSVLEPLDRLMALVRSADRKGLSEYELTARGDYGQLSHGIISMTQRLEEDRARIAAQLEELTRAHAELGAAQERLVRAERLAVVGQLAAGLAHEIGNPLTVLMGFVDVLKGAGVTPTEQRDALARMGRELDRIHATVRELLDFGRASTMAEGAGELCAVLEHVEHLLRPQARFRGVTLSVRGPAQPVLVPLDRMALTQVVLNLLLNAADAVAGAGQVSLDVTCTTTSVALVVEDSGPGVPPELCTRIFEPFFSTKPAGQGTGLGLAVVAHLVTAVGGDIQVETATLGGARFRVSLPVLAPAAQ